MEVELIEHKGIMEILLEIDSEQNVRENANEIINRLQKDDNVLIEVLNIIDELITNKLEICNLLAITSFENEAFDSIIPLLQKALEYNPLHKDTLINLSIVLAEFGEVELALSYAQKIDDQSDDVIELLRKLSDMNRTSLSIGENILSIEQNDVQFTGERLVINQEVKDKYKNVMEEHIHRYQLACKHVEGKIVLDAACGAGYGSKMIQQAGAKLVLGVDVSEESIQNAQQVYGANNVDFVYGDVNRLAFDEASFDVVVSFETIEHIENGTNWIRESARVLKDDGLFLVSTPNRMITNPGTYFVEKPLNPHHQFEYSVTEFVGELLKEYDVLELYGQTFFNDHETYYSKVMRQLRKMRTDFVSDRGVQTKGHELIPLGNVKDAQPMYVVAVCKKKIKNAKTV